MFPDAEWATQHEAVLRDWADALADHRRGDPVTTPAPTPTIATSFEQDARDAAPDEDRLLDTLADSITRGATPLQAAQHLFGGRRD